MKRLFAIFSLAVVPALATAVPFTQCPHIGNATSCNVLLTIDNTGTVSIATDPAIPPYDGAEDMLVGVENLWNKAVASLTLTGSNIFGFDGDGAGSPTCLVSGSGPCPFNLGPTGYEGLVANDASRLVTFNILNANQGNVIFAGGLAPNETAWFSLEEPPSAASGISGRVNPTPEPAILYLFAIGLAGLGFGRRQAVV